MCHKILKIKYFELEVKKMGEGLKNSIVLNVKEVWRIIMKICKIILPLLLDFLSVSCFSSFIAATSRASANIFTIEELMLRLGYVRDLWKNTFYNGEGNKLAITFF